MLQHPGTELQLLIKEKGLTQKAFASILGKKVSEVNELLKGKRNITIQRDYLLHQTLGTPIKYWILKQIDYDYSLIDIDETSLPTPQSLRDSSQPPLNPLLTEGTTETFASREQNSDDNFTPLGGGDAEGRGGGLQHYDRHSEQSEESRKTGNQMDSSVDSLPQNDNTTQKENKPQETPIQEQKNENNEDFKKRANIFRTF